MDADPPFRPTPVDAAIDHQASIAYWESVSSDNDGMLGGYPQISRIDLVGSSNFLTKLRRSRQSASGSSKQPLEQLGRVADCGAGIGRITNGLLMDVATRVDVVEPVKKFTDELVAGLSDQDKAKIGAVINLGLQDWVPEPGTYDVIWNQWCLVHLTDAQLVLYLQRCKAGLTQSRTSWIVVKENMSTAFRNQDIYDEEDSSVTRSDDKFRALFKEAGLRIVATELQKGFPKGLYPVRVYALRAE